MPRRRPRLPRHRPITPLEWNAYIDAAVSEKDWQEHVRQAFRWTGWELYYHTWVAKNSPKGFPDVVAARFGDPLRPMRFLVAELKREGEAPTDEQEAWLDIFRQLGPPVEVYVWRPADRDTMLEILQ